MICADLPLAVGDRVILFSCTWPPDGYEGVVESCEPWESLGYAVRVRVDDTRAQTWQRGTEARPTGFHGQARAFPLWTRRLFCALAQAREDAQRAAMQGDALRSALVGGDVVARLDRIEAALKGGAK